ncbi:MAG: sigma 54-interacting transcriptional regulator, partial [Deltaproteobacteria bacterium]|nr:sigma 54-interacting transcriptional regulator [Deltaproteobacteria bacterium]
DLRLSDPTVSRAHFEIRDDRDGYVLTDLRSTNGTIVDGVRAREVVLDRAHALVAGQSTLRFELSDRETEVEVPKAGFGGLVGSSPAMRRVYATLARAAPRDVTVLIEGETGTGKEVAARAIHAASARAMQPFVVVDCASLPANLIEAELFGYERGAFTGAVTARAGAFEMADGGTVFLDELGELAPELQPKLLRALESREVRRLGGAQPRAVDVRVVAATNRDLRAEVNDGTFRADLYYRLAVVTVRLPSLRDRPEDIPEIARHLVARIAEQSGLALTVSDETLERLKRRRWPGYVRELRNFLERAVTMSDGDHLELGATTEAGADASKVAPATDSAGAPVIEHDLPYRVAKQRWTDAFEARYLPALLTRCEGNVSRAAREAEMDRAYLIKLLKRYDVR